MRSIWTNLALTFKMIKIEHSVFALPFALISALVAAGGLPDARTLMWILVAMVSARSCAMAFNRFADYKFDRLNPRTSRWPLPSGALSLRFVILFIMGCSALFLFSAYRLNRLAFILSPIALFLICFYSFTKRFTLLSHWFIGLALAIGPAGAWIAVRGNLEVLPVILSLSLLFWVAGFDLIYSCQDAEFDRNQKLHSVPSRYGISAALTLSALCHAAMICFLIAFGYMARLGIWYYLGAVLVATLLVYEHLIVSPTNLTRVNEAFFTVNGLVSVLLLITTSLDLYL